MESIFKKLEAVKINASDLLQPYDKAFCEKIFALYEQHKCFIKKILETTGEGYKNHVNAYPISAQDFYYDMDKMEKISEGLEEIISSLEGTLIRKTENFFKEKYNLVFDAYQKDKKSADALSLEAIIDNIIAQSGTDLIQAGKDQIKLRLRQIFRTPSRQPNLKNSKISLPNFFYPRTTFMSDETSLNYNDTEVSKLLDAIALFVFDSLEQPEIFKKQLEDWKLKIDFTISYELQPELTIKFFKNRRIDISFPSTDEAEKFWQDHGLENVVALNNSRD